MLKNFPSINNKDELNRYYELPSKRHLNRKEIDMLDKIYDLYLKVCSANEFLLKAEALQEHFFSVLDNNNLNYKYYRKYYNSYAEEIEDSADISDFEGIDYDIKRALAINENSNDNIELTKKINKIFNCYLVKYKITDEKIDFFQDLNIESIVNAYPRYIEWRNNISAYSDAKKEFIKIKD